MSPKILKALVPLAESHPQLTISCKKFSWQLRNCTIKCEARTAKFIQCHLLLHDYRRIFLRLSLSFLPPMTMLILLPTPTRTGIIPAHLFFSASHCLYSRSFAAGGFGGSTSGLLGTVGADSAEIGLLLACLLDSIAAADHQPSLHQIGAHFFIDLIDKLLEQSVGFHLINHKRILLLE